MAQNRMIRPIGEGLTSDSPALPIPNRGQLDIFNVNRDGWEGYTNGLYDSNAYAAAGHTQLMFFQLPQGQGTGVGGAAKTFTDTNMVSAGQMPSQQEFLIQGIEILFNTTVPTVVGEMPSSVESPPTILAFINDAYIFWRSGNLNLFIGSKSYCQEAPLMKFPPRAWFDVTGSIGGSTTAADTLARAALYATAKGTCYALKAWLRLVSNQNFNVTLNWPEGLQVIISPARVYLTLNGVQYRRSQ